MNTEKQNNRFCRSCRYYTAYYEKCHSYFYKQKSGQCMKLQKRVSSKDLCTLYKRRPPQKITVTLEHIDSVIADLKEIERILQINDH